MSATAQSARKILVIIGTTGVGKTKLSVDIAKAINGEIVNSDAMQMYKGLDVATAKVTPEEMDGIQHHVLDFLEPTESVTVHQYCQRALKAIDDIHARGKLPVLVGGTMYYVESLLWPGSLMNDAASKFDSDLDNNGSKISCNANLRPHYLDTLDSVGLHNLLKKIDPTMAIRLHPNDIRKTRRSLDIYRQSGKKQSDWIHLQKQHVENLQPRFDCQALWLDCDSNILDTRLDNRVDTMMSNGLLKEVYGLWNFYRTSPSLKSGEEIESQDNKIVEKKVETSKMDFESGVLQSIGFKEFATMLEAMPNIKSHDSVPPTNISQLVCPNLLASSLENLKRSTRRYARKQLRWIRNRFIKRNVSVFKMDSSNALDPVKWKHEVFDPSMKVTVDFLNGKNSSNITSKDCSMNENKKVNATNIPQMAKSLSEWKKFPCEICGKILNGQHEWDEHIVSRKHKRKMKAKADRKRQREEGPKIAAARALKRKQLEKGFTLR